MFLVSSKFICGLFRERAREIKMTRFSAILLLITLSETLLVSSYPTLGSGLKTRGSDILEHHGLSIGLSNFSANLPPTDFDFDVTKGDRDADSRGCFWLTLKAISDLAKHPFDGVYPGSWMAKYPNDHRLMLVLSGNNVAGFRVKDMIWGLLSAIKYMNDRDEFRNYRFTLRWHNQVVGSIIFARTLRGGLDANNASISHATLNTRILTMPAPKQRLNATLDFKPGWERAHEPLDFNEVMMTLISGYSELAVHDPSQRVNNNAFRTVWRPYGTIFELKSVAPAPLWFTYGVVFESLIRLSNWYFQHTECRSAYVWVLTDGQYVGHGALMGRTSSPPIAEARQNISTS